MIIQDNIVAVVPLRPVRQAYHYAVPAGEVAMVGQLVTIAFGKSECLGLVWPQSLLHASNTPHLAKLKTIITIHHNVPVLAEKHCEFLQWSADYTMGLLGLVAKMAVPINNVMMAEPHIAIYSLNPNITLEKLTPTRQKIVAALQNHGPQSAAALKLLIGTTASVVKAMAQAGQLLVTHHVRQQGPLKLDEKIMTLPPFSAAQSQVADALVNKVSVKKFSVSLLDGVTGSGKTEVYFAPMQQALRQGQQALVLVPEIALTATFLQRFVKRFGASPVVWHSNLTPAQRRRALKALASGHAQVVVGARSALFLPYHNLGLVVIDEEHDSSYKQEEGVHYHARDLAIKRAQLQSFPVILASATPSAETYAQAQNNRYDWLKLPNRHGGAAMPTQNIIDMRTENLGRQEFLGPTLRTQIAQTLARGEQTLLYLNRRGFAPLLLCRKCGTRVQCPSCTAWLVTHQRANKVQCHHCGYHAPVPNICSKCETANSFAMCGPGVERIAHEVGLAFPEARLLILSSDTHTSMAQLDTSLKDITAEKIDIIIGTQMIAKGHHFPKMTLVGVVDADLGLAGGDLRAAERTFQLLQQVAGRAGREAKLGHVFLQTYQPENRVIQAILQGDRDGFLDLELAERQALAMPPFGRLAAIVLSGPKEAQVQLAAQMLARVAPNNQDLRTLGPAQAAMYKLRNNYRWRFLLKTPKNMLPQQVIKTWLAAVKLPPSVRVQIDIDPYNFS